MPTRPVSTVAARTMGGFLVLPILGLLMAFASISTDFYLPALPAMAASLHEIPGAAAFTISGYLIGFSVGQLFWGPLGDRYGRRAPIAIGLLLFILGSAGCAMSCSAPAIIFWRVVQALGACASVVLARAIVRDLYAGAQAARMMSSLMTVMAIAPLVGPGLGGKIFIHAGWRAIFWTLVGIGVLTLAALLALPDTLPPARRNTEPLGRAFVSYKILLRNRRLLAYMGTGGFYYAGTFAYVAGSPFAYITYHHLPPQFYGVLFGAGIIGIMATNLINRQFVQHVGSDRLMIFGLIGAALAGTILAFDAWTDCGGLAGLAIPLFVYVSAMGFIIANAISCALAKSPERTGVVSALVGCVQYGGGVLGSASVGAFADGTPSSMGLVVALCAVGGVLCTLPLWAAPKERTTRTW